nr:hypothetical protein BaRGS_008008 [Batillaria attramentaria]
MTKRSMEERAVTCDCSGSSCSCCADINFNSFGFDIDDRGCLSVSTDDDMYTVTLKLGSKTLYTETLPFGTLPTPCLKFGAARICLEFYDVNWDLADFGGCARAKVKFLGFTVSKLKLGCFDF